MQVLLTGYDGASGMAVRPYGPMMKAIRARTMSQMGKEMVSQTGKLGETCCQMGTEKAIWANKDKPYGLVNNSHKGCEMDAIWANKEAKRSCDQWCHTGTERPHWLDQCI